MKILFVQNMDGVSGSELLLQQMLPEMKRRGEQPEMLIIFRRATIKNAEFVKILKEAGVPVYEIYGHHPLSVFLILKIRTLLRSGKYDLLHCNLVHADLWMAIQKMLFFRKTGIVSVKHGFDEKYIARYGFDPKQLKGNFYAKVQRLSDRYINRNVTVSKGVYDLYVKGRISTAEKTQVVYNGLSLKHLEGQQFERPVSGKYAVILGRLVPYKGQDYLIRAWQKVKAHDNTLKLCIVGQGANRQALESLVAECGLKEQVIFAGFQPNPHAYLHFADFSLVTSVCEPFGLIILESWYHEKPVIAFDVSAMNEIIDDEVNGLLSKAFDVDELARKIIYLFTHNQEAATMGQKGCEKLKAYYSLERMTDDMMAIYKSVNTKNSI